MHPSYNSHSSLGFGMDVQNMGQSVGQQNFLAVPFLFGLFYV
jgi:hypothetical protein